MHALLNGHNFAATAHYIHSCVDDALLLAASLLVIVTIPHRNLMIRAIQLIEDYG